MRESTWIQSYSGRWPGGTSDRTAVDASWRWPDTRLRRGPSTSGRGLAASGRRRTPVRTGRISPTAISTTSAIGAIAVSQSDPNVIYVGTGEATIRGNVSHGDGVYKSTDGGKSWVERWTDATPAISAMSSSIPTIPIPSTSRHSATPGATNEERGVFRSTDGGTTWAKILYKSDRAGAVDLAIDASNPRILYATIFQVQRHPHTLVRVLARIAASGARLRRWRHLGRDHLASLECSRKACTARSASPLRPPNRAESGRSSSTRMARSTARTTTATPGRTERQGGLRRSSLVLHAHRTPTRATPTPSGFSTAHAGSRSTAARASPSVPTPHGDNHDLWIDPERLATG